MSFTDFTKITGDVIAKIKNNNKLIDELNKRYNPTFLEIIEDLQENDETLAKMLLLWYMTKYSIDESKIDDIMADIRKEYTKVKRKALTNDSYEYTCGRSNNYSSGCGGSSSSHNYSSGCGSSLRSTGGC